MSGSIGKFQILRQVQGRSKPKGNPYQYSKCVLMGTQRRPINTLNNTLLQNHWSPSRTPGGPRTPSVDSLLSKLSISSRSAPRLTLRFQSVAVGLRICIAVCLSWGWAFCFSTKTWEERERKKRRIVFYFKTAKWQILEQISVKNNCPIN